MACERALERGAEVVFVDNRAIVVEGPTDLDSSLGELIDLSLDRGRNRMRATDERDVHDPTDEGTA